MWETLTWLHLLNSWHLIIYFYRFLTINTSFSYSAFINIIYLVTGSKNIGEPFHVKSLDCNKEMCTFPLSGQNASRGACLPPSLLASALTWSLKSECTTGSLTVVKRRLFVTNWPSTRLSAVRLPHPPTPTFHPVPSMVITHPHAWKFEREIRMA